MVCKIFFYSEFPNIPDTAGRKTRRRGRKTQAIANCYVFHGNAKTGNSKVLCFTGKRSDIALMPLVLTLKKPLINKGFIVLTSSLKTALHGGSSTGKL